jgi:opacity protein-like surface antigen
MAKKGLLVLILAAIVVMGAYAAPPFRIGIGGGGYFTSDFGGGAEVSGGGWRVAFETPYAGGGGFLFFDITYAELSFGFFTGGGDIKFVGDAGTLGSVFDEHIGYSLTGIDIGIMGKFPFVLNSKLLLFPLLGINYRSILSYKNEEGNEADKPEDSSALWFKLGVGLDCSFTDNLFLRFGLTYGIRTLTQRDKDLWEFLKTATDSLPKDESGTRIGHGLEARIAVGYKF